MESEKIGNTFLQNVSKLLPGCIASHPRYISFHTYKCFSCQRATNWMAEELGVRFLKAASDFSLLHTAQACPASYPVDYGSCFSGSNIAGV
jgi:hypothetical protein